MYYYLVNILYSTVHLNFTYHSDIQYLIGDIVKIALKNKIQWAVIIDFADPPSFLTKPIIEKFICSQSYAVFLKRIEQYYVINPIWLLKKVTDQYRPTKKSDTIPIEFCHELSKKQEIVTLSQKQQNAVTFFLDKIAQIPLLPCLLHGLTGSGKTIVYMTLISHYLNNKKSILYLCPNVSLANEIGQVMLKHGLNQIYFFDYHTDKKEKKKMWDAIIAVNSIIIIGVHMPIWLPILNLGLIIIDEEHDSQYGNQNAPYWNTKEIALLRAQAEHIPILLGSATPSIQTLFQVFEKKYHYFYLNEKYHLTESAKITPIIFEKKKTGNYLSQYAQEKMYEALSSDQQVLLYLNKKGLYKYARCNHCQNTIICSHCTITMTIYQHNIASCSRCEAKIILPDSCPKCQKKYTIHCRGVGIEKIKNDLTKQYPTKKICIIQGEKNKKNKIDKNSFNDADIIIGTDMVTQGYNFTRLSLIIIINADQNLHIPHYLIFEETMQKLIQIIGRANRFVNNGEVILQSYNDLQQYIPFLSEPQYLDFVTNELQIRKDFTLPPYWKRSILIIKGVNEQVVANFTEKIYNDILKSVQTNNEYLDINIHRPLPAIIKKIKNKYYWHIIITARYYHLNYQIAKIILEKYKTIQNATIHFVPYHLHPIYE